MPEKQAARKYLRENVMKGLARGKSTDSVRAFDPRETGHGTKTKPRENGFMKKTSLTKLAALAAVFAAALSGLAKADGTTFYSANNGQIEEWQTSTSGGATTLNEVNSIAAPTGYNAATVVIGADGTVYVASNTIGAPAGATTTVISSYNSSLGLINSDVASFAGYWDGFTEGSTTALAISGNTLYALNSSYYPGQIETVDLTTGTVSTLGGSSNVYYDGLGNMALGNGVIYGSAYQSGSVETIDPTTGAYVNPNLLAGGTGLPEGSDSGPGGVAVIGNTLFVVDDTNGAGDQVDEYNATTGDLIKQGYATGDYISSITISGGYLYVNDYDAADGGGPTTQQYYLADPSLGGSSDGGLVFNGNGFDPVNAFAALGTEGIPTNFTGSAAPEPRSMAFALGVLAMVGLLRKRTFGLSI